MNTIVKKFLWFCYYVYDLLKCAPKKNTVHEIDAKITQRLSKAISDKNPEQIIIFATYEKNVSDEYISYFLANLKDKFVVIINNTNIGEFGIECEVDNYIWVNRPNFGRDISCYAVGINSVVLAESRNIKDVCLINDSVYILKTSFFDFFNHEFRSDILAHSFSVNPYPHARSYLLRIKISVAVRLYDYLKKLPTAKSRYNAVINGEIGMSKAIFLKHRIGIWSYQRMLEEDNFINDLPVFDVFTAGIYSEEFTRNLKSLRHLPEKFAESFAEKFAESFADDARERFYLKNILNDPYELSHNTPGFRPDIIKREVVEKGLASKQLAYSVVEHSELPGSAKVELLENILIPKRYLGIKTRLKMMIGEI